jgi:hypothetical protein
MAAARQKEMNVSITEEATIRRTRFEGGATKVLDAIVNVSARRPLSLFNTGKSPHALQRFYFQISRASMKMPVNAMIKPSVA